MESNIFFKKSDFFWTMDKNHRPAPPSSYLQEPVAGLPDEGEAHGAFGHGQLAVFVSRGGPAELPQLLGHHQQQRHGHQAGGQGGQSGHQVEAVEQHDGAEESGERCAQNFWSFFAFFVADVRFLRARSEDALRMNEVCALGLLPLKI